MGNGCSKCCQCNEHKQYHGTLSSASSVYRRRSRAEFPIENSDRFRITQTSSAVQLAVEHVQREDAGHYTLIARTKSSKVIRKNVELIVEDRSTGEDPPVFLRRLADLSVKVGTRTRLLIEIRSSTDVKLTWYRNDRRICENNRIHKLSEANYHYLEISPVILEDGGQWMVLAENAGGRNSCIAHLNVLVPKAYKSPEFIEELRAVLTQQGTVSLECKVIGVPTPQLRWFKDSKEIKAGDVFALTANVDDPTSLGTYTCEAINCMGKSYSSSKVHVMGRGSREGSLKPADSIPNNAPPPIFTNELRDMSVRIGEPIILGCQVVVPPWPKTVVWYNKNGRIESGERYKLIEDGLGVYMIEIKPSVSCDEGEWKCVVTSYEGCVGISTCNVAMDIPKNYRKPRFMETLRAVLTEEGLVSFECKVVGFPTPILKWFKDGQELKPGDVYQLTGTNSLGSYCCVAQNSMGESSSVAVLTIEDIQNQLNDEERLIFAKQNQPPKFVVGLKSQEVKINESFQFTVNVKATPKPVLSWFRDELPIENNERYNHYHGEEENWHLDIRCVEFVDQAEWKCVAANDFGTSVTSSYLKLQIPRHYKKPRFLECLRAVLTEEGAVNLECKVIGVPQPVLKWYKDGLELRPGDIHKIISGQDGTCCLGTYTCEARNCMGVVASSASLLGFEDAYKNQKQEQVKQNVLQRNLSLSTIQEEHTSQLYETPTGEITIDSKGDVSFSFDGKEVSVSLYETPDLTEEEALKIVEMYADQISEHVTEHNVVELPPLRFVKETSQSGKLLMEAVVIDISPEYFAHDEDMRTEAGIDDISITEITVHGSSGRGSAGHAEDQVDHKVDNYARQSFDKMEEELALTTPVRKRKKSKPTEATEEFYSLSKGTSDSQAGGDDEDTSDLQTYASATQMSSHVDSAAGIDKTPIEEGVQPPKRKKGGKRQTDSDSSITNEEDAKMQDISGAVGDGLMTVKDVKIISNAADIEENLRILLPLAKFLKTIDHHLSVVENEVVEQSAIMMTPSAAEQSIAIIRNIMDPMRQVESKLHVYSGETPLDALFQTMEEDIRKLHTSLQVIEKCVEIDETGITLIQRTSVCIIDSVGDLLIKALGEVQRIAKSFVSSSLRAHIDLTADDIRQGLEITQGTIKSQALLQEAQELEAAKHLSDTVAKLQEVPKSESISFANISEVKLPAEADALKLICQPVVNIQVALEKVETELSLEANEEEIYKKVHKKVLDNIVEPIRELQTVLESIEHKAESLGGSESTEQKVNMAILDIVTPALFELNKGLEVILNESSDNVHAGMLTVNTVESMVPPLQEIQSGLAQLSQDVESGQFNEEAALDSADTQKLLQSIAQSVLHFETNIDRLTKRLPRNVQTGLYNLEEEMSTLIGNVLDENITKYHVTLLENLKRPIDELNYCIRQIENKSITGSLTDFLDPLHGLTDRVNLGREIMHMAGPKCSEKNSLILERMQKLIRSVEIDIEEHEFKMLQREVELDKHLATQEEKSFLYMRQAMEMKIAQDEAGQNIQELLHTVTEIEATPGLDEQTQAVLSQLDQSLTGLVADVEKLKESSITREENEAATKVLTDIAKPLQTAAEVLRRSLTPAKELKIESLPQSVSLKAVLQELNEIVENIPEQNEELIQLKALPIVQSMIKIVPALQTITELPHALNAVVNAEIAEKKKTITLELENCAAKRLKLETKTKEASLITGDQSTSLKYQQSTESQKAESSIEPSKPPAANIEDEPSTLDDISAIKSVAESLPTDIQISIADDQVDHLKAFEANKGKVNVLLSQLKNSIASVLSHCTEVDVGSLQLATAQQVKATLTKLEGVKECIADVHQPVVSEALHSLSDASECKTFAEALCHLEACVVQVEECVAQSDLQELSENSISELKILALPLQDIRECIKVFHNEELEQVMSLQTASLPLTNAQVLQHIQPFVLTIKENHAIETLQSLVETHAEESAFVQLKQFIQPIQELETALLSTVDQVHLSQIESLTDQASFDLMKKCVKPIADITEAILHVQEETPLSTLGECTVMQVIKQKADAIYNLIQYCEHVDIDALENIADISTQADVSALKSCAELKSVELALEPVVQAKRETVKFLDVKESIADGIKQLQQCLKSTTETNVPELHNVGEVMKDLKYELQNMHTELSKVPAQQGVAHANQRVAKAMFRLKECLVHTYETGVESSLDEIERTFEDILQALPTLEIQLAAEMYAKIATSLQAFSKACSQADYDELNILVEPLNHVLISTKSISELKSIDIEKSSLAVANIQSHLMATFRGFNEVSESLPGQWRVETLKAQDAVLAAHEYIVEANEPLRVIELLQEIDSLSTTLATIHESVALAKEEESKRALFETLSQRVSNAKAFLQSIEEGLKADNAVFYNLAEKNELDIRSVEAALIRIENEILPKLDTRSPTSDDRALVDVLGVHLKVLQDSFNQINTETATLTKKSLEKYPQLEQTNEELNTPNTPSTIGHSEPQVVEKAQDTITLSIEEDISTLEEISAIESLIGSSPPSQAEKFATQSATPTSLTTPTETLEIEADKESEETQKPVRYITTDLSVIDRAAVMDVSNVEVIYLIEEYEEVEEEEIIEEVKPKKKAKARKARTPRKSIDKDLGSGFSSEAEGDAGEANGADDREDSVDLEELDEPVKKTKKKAAPKKKEKSPSPKLTLKLEMGGGQKASKKMFEEQSSAPKPPPKKSKLVLQMEEQAKAAAKAAEEEAAKASSKPKGETYAERQARLQKEKEEQERIEAEREALLAEEEEEEPEDEQVEEEDEAGNESNFGTESVGGEYGDEAGSEYRDEEEEEGEEADVVPELPKGKNRRGSNSSEEFTRPNPYDEERWKRIAEEEGEEFMQQMRKYSMRIHKSEKERDAEWQRIREQARLPHFIVFLTDRTVEAGHSVRLSCAVSGPELSVKWFKDGRQLERDAKHRIINNNNILVLEVLSTTILDSGEYTCTVANMNDTVNSSCYVTIYEVFKDEPAPPSCRLIKEYYHLRDDELTIECHLHGVPRPTVVWVKGGLEIKPSCKFTMIEEAHGVYKLLIYKPTDRDNGNYICKAINSSGEVQISHHVEVAKNRHFHARGIFHARTRLSKDIELSTKKAMEEALQSKAASDLKRSTAAAEARERVHRASPEPQVSQKQKLQFATQLRDRMALEGSTVRFVCTVIGPSPSCRWMKDDKWVVVGPNVKNLSEEGKAILEVIKVTSESSGVYKCVAKNDFSEIETQCYFKVYSAQADGDEQEPIFALPLRDVYHSSQNDLIIDTKVRGNPRPKITWIKDNIPVVLDDRRVQIEHLDGVCELIINKPTTNDSGVYTCTAENKLGSQKTTHTVVVDVVQSSRRSSLLSNVMPESDGEAGAGETGGKKADRRGSRLPKSKKKDVEAEGGEYERRSRIPDPSPKTQLYFIANLSNRYIPIGSKVKFQAVVGGPDATFKWQKDEQNVTYGPRIRNMSREGMACLEFLNTAPEDSGVYTLTAQNEFCKITTSALLHVFSSKVSSEVEPMFTRSLKEIYHLNTNELVLETGVRGNPMPQVQWIKDNFEIKNGGRNQILQHQDGTCELIIDRPDAKDSGKYVVRAENSAGKAEILHTVLFQGQASHIADNIHGVFHADKSLLRPKATEEVKPAVKESKEEASEGDGEDKDAKGRRKSKVKKPKKEEEEAISSATDIVSDASSLKKREKVIGIHFATSVRDRVVAEGSKVKISCFLESKEPQVKWFKNDEPVVNGPKIRGRFMEGLCLLEITSATVEDSGVYKCWARDETGEASTFCKLEVYADPGTGDVPPTFTRNIKDTYHGKIHELQLDVHVRGLPTPTVTWVKDGVKIEPSEKYQQIDHDDGSCELFVIDPTPADSGKYVCQAENREGKTEITHIVTVQPRVRRPVSPSRPPVKPSAGEEEQTEGEGEGEGQAGQEKRKRKPKDDEESGGGRREAPPPPDLKKYLYLRNFLSNRTVKAGSNVKWMVNIDGPEPTARWYHGDQPITFGPKSKMSCQDGIAWLNLIGVTEEDAGEYTLRIKGSENEVVSTCQLFVYTVGVEEVVAPVFTVGIKDTYSIHENTLVLDCRVRGKPRPEVQWMKGNDLLNNGDRYDVQNTADGYCKLVINNPTEKDSGLYACVARNEGAENKITHHVDFAGRERFTLEKTHGYFHRDPNKPHFLVPLSSQTVCPGGTVAISAEFMKSISPLEVHWLRGRKSVAGQPGVQTFMDGGVYTLAILDAQPEVEGTYTCRASNAFGRIESHVSVDVAAGVEKCERPPLFLSRPETEMKILVGDPFSISFRIAGDPKPKLTFLKGTKDITKSDRVSKEVSDDFTRFTVQSAQVPDSGTYFVVARNNFGTDRVFVTIAVKAPKRKESSTPSH